MISNGIFILVHRKETSVVRSFFFFSFEVLNFVLALLTMVLFLFPFEEMCTCASINDSLCIVIIIFSTQDRARGSDERLARTHAQVAGD